ncbi:c-type cytochrome [Orrella sp. JC864]|uniref:c-type cytochrome n=1 Tax=Orrella sp. JC864 TaxID=3120298 RepID=UPI0012BB9CA0
MSKAAWTLALLCAALPAASQTLQGQALAKARQCLACHQVDSKRVGPSFKAVAERYAGQQGAQDYLAQAIRRGGRGRWGAIPMPAQPQVDEQAAHDLARWILSLEQPDS